MERINVTYTTEIEPVSQEAGGAQDMEPSAAQIIASMTKLQESVTALQGSVTVLQEMVASLRDAITSIGQRLSRLEGSYDLLPIRLYNTSASLTAPLRYPPDVDTTRLPRTPHDLWEFSAQQFRQAAAALGLPALPKNSTLLEQRRQIGDHIGVPI
ncbi:hypothetical protein ABW19_dt0206275 [Dactylella cylindrospora]|nr:hypothetical protein ABW19_dt0206275 [Dactylella cylindrospora]